MANRSNFCPPEVNRLLGNRPRTHANLREITNQVFGRAVARPGKTAQERARKGGSK